MMTGGERKSWATVTSILKQGHGQTHATSVTAPSHSLTLLHVMVSTHPDHLSPASIGACCPQPTDDRVFEV